jgi:hypothetical protein
MPQKPLGLFSSKGRNIGTKLQKTAYCDSALAEDVCKPLTLTGLVASRKLERELHGYG